MCEQHGVPPQLILDSVYGTAGGARRPNRGGDIFGAKLPVYPTAIGWHPREKAEFGVQQCDARQTIQRGHAIASVVDVAAVNRVGHEGPPDAGLEFRGGPFVCDPYGVVLQRANHDREEVSIAGFEWPKFCFAAVGGTAKRSSDEGGDQADGCCW